MAMKWKKPIEARLVLLTVEKRLNKKEHEKIVKK